MFEPVTVDDVTVNKNCHFKHDSCIVYAEASKKAISWCMVCRLSVTLWLAASLPPLLTAVTTACWSLICQKHALIFNKIWHRTACNICHANWQSDRHDMHMALFRVRDGFISAQVSEIFHEPLGELKIGDEC